MPVLEETEKVDIRSAGPGVLSRAGCVKAETYQKEFVEKEPFDCQLEYQL